LTPELGITENFVRSVMRQTPTFSMSRRMVQAIAAVAVQRGESMSEVVRAAVRAYVSLDQDDRPVRQPAPNPGDWSTHAGDATRKGAE
jgi:Arc/MetJ-type ribon-helix-helix transcriptional regulator